MTTPTSPALTAPLLTVDDMIGRVNALLAPALNPGQLWVMFLDLNGLQTPVLIPIDDCPALPDIAAVEFLAECAADLISDTLDGHGSVLLVRERLGSPDATVEDHAWAAALDGALRRADVPLAGLFLLTPGGAQPLQP